MSAGSVAFRHAVDERWAVPVKNTFISFDNPLALPTACLRSSTCPPLYRLGGFLTQDDITWESATQELCHCMAPRRPSRGRAPLAPVAVEQCSTVAASSDNAQAVESSETSAPLSPVACDAMASKSNTRELVEGPKEVVSACSKGKGAPDREGEADAMSEVSTKESEGSLERGKSSTVQQWTSVLSKSKKSKGAGCVESRGKHGDTSPPANGRASRARGEQQGSGRGAQAVDAPQSPTAAAPVTPKGYGKGKGKGQGKSRDRGRAASANPNQAVSNEELPTLIEASEEERAAVADEEQPARAPAAILPGSRREGPPPNLLAVGKGVRLKDLVSAAQWNGQMGVLEEWDPTAGRWLVRMISNNEIKKLKPENLEAEAQITLRIRDEKGAFGGGFFYVTAGETWKVSRIKEQIEVDTEVLREEVGLLIAERLLEDDEMVEVLMKSEVEASRRYTECMDLNIIRRPVLKTVEHESVLGGTSIDADRFSSWLSRTANQGYPSMVTPGAHFSSISNNLLASSAEFSGLQKVGMQRRGPVVNLRSPAALRSPAGARSNLTAMAR
mmetsp:Transcript_87321/g.152406  ORF Transcript_87321/g.152406 Transcript_87321/m.152406 type:complete len:558 (-) Transcript_87321:82-1755(-)